MKRKASDNVPDRAAALRDALVRLQWQAARVVNTATQLQLYRNMQAIRVQLRDTRR